MRRSSSVSRRQFLSQSATAAAISIAAPAVLTASKTDSQIVIGEGDYQYEVQHDWPQLPAKFRWQTTHNVAVDKAQNLYVIHRGLEEQADHPSIFVFDNTGKFVRAFGSPFQGAGHGIEVREEGGEEFLYVCIYQHIKSVFKLTLTGETVWEIRAPLESGVYAEEEVTNPTKARGRNRFLPTNIAFLPDGDFFLADGYGSFYIHRFDKEGTYKTSFGGPGAGKGTFSTPHGIWVDSRPGRETQIVVADRAHHTLQYLTLDGEYIETIEGFGLPANLDTYQNLLLVPELVARVSLLDENNKVVAQLGEDVARLTADKKRQIRTDPGQWLPGKFVHPHDACFDADGNIFVADWVETGRVTKLKRLS